MESLGLITVCVSAFIAVFVVLSLLAILMRIIILIFPEKESNDDAAVIAALTTIINKFYPGFKITKTEEVK